MPPPVPGAFHRNRESRCIRISWVGISASGQSRRGYGTSLLWRVMAEDLPGYEDVNTDFKIEKLTK